MCLPPSKHFAQAHLPPGEGVFAFTHSLMYSFSALVQPTLLFLRQGPAGSWRTNAFLFTGATAGPGAGAGAGAGAAGEPAATAVTAATGAGAAGAAGAGAAAAARGGAA